MHVRMYILPTQIYFQFWAASGSVRQREATSANTSVFEGKTSLFMPSHERSTFATLTGANLAIPEILLKHPSN